jgi:ATP-dependent exoDNAse (exonuclease V) alpha subunit
LADIIACGAVPVVRLTEVFRQAAESQIIVNAHQINHGLMPNLAPAESGDFYFVDAADAEDGVKKVLAIVRERIPEAFRVRPDTRCPGALPNEPRRPRRPVPQYRASERTEPARRDPH